MIQLFAFLVLASILAVGVRLSQVLTGGIRVRFVAWTLASSAPVFLFGGILPYLAEHPEVLRHILSVLRVSGEMLWAPVLSLAYLSAVYLLSPAAVLVIFHCLPSQSLYRATAELLGCSWDLQDVEDMASFPDQMLDPKPQFRVIRGLMGIAALSATGLLYWTTLPVIAVFFGVLTLGCCGLSQLMVFDAHRMKRFNWHDHQAEKRKKAKEERRRAKAERKAAKEATKPD